MSFTDDTLQPRITPIKAVHVTELQGAVAAVRNIAGLASVAFPGVSFGTVIRASHFQQLREALAEARTTLELPTGPYGAAPGPPGVIRVADIEEISQLLR